MNIERRTITDREEWLTWRRQDVTASTVGALFRCHPFVTSLKIFSEKQGVEFNQEETSAMRRGRWLEPAVAAAVHDLRPEWTVEAPRIYLRDPELRLGCTPDFYIHGDPRGLGILQAKSVAPSVFEREWDEGLQPPRWISLQAVTEAMLADAAFGVIAALLVDPHSMDCIIYDFPRNAETEAEIIAAVKDFWSMVMNGREPEPDYGRDADVIKALRPREVPGKTIDFTGDNKIPMLLEERARLRAEMAESKSDSDRIDAEIKYRMGDAETAVGLNGWRISYKVVDTKGYVVQPRQSRTLRITDKRPPEERPEVA